MKDFKKKEKKKKVAGWENTEYLYYGETCTAWNPEQIWFPVVKQEKKPGNVGSFQADRNLGPQSNSTVQNRLEIKMAGHLGSTAESSSHIYLTWY